VWDEAATRLRDTHAFEYIKQLHSQSAKEEAKKGAASR
jgi:hypothetical protein